jgi:hypothetical protein
MVPSRIAVGLIGAVLSAGDGRIMLSSKPGKLARETKATSIRSGYRFIPLSRMRFQNPRPSVAATNEII